MRYSPSAVATRARDHLEQCIQIDTRTLAVFRVFVSLLILADLVLRARNFSYFYTDDGVVPRSLAMELSADYAFSFYHISTNSSVIAALFVLQGLIALQLLVGYKTRVAAILSFLFVISLDNHNPLVLSYADTLFRLLLFWAMFLPLGERWSVDATHTNRDPRPYVASIASALILIQMVFMYFTNGIIKSLSTSWTGGSAAPKVLGLDEMTFLLGDTVRNFPTLLEYGGFTWYVMLVFSWLLLVLRGRRRMLLIAMFVAGHASFAITVRIGAFAYVAIAGLILFVPAQFWSDGRSLAEYASIDVSRLSERLRGLQALGAYFPAYGFDSERARRVKGQAYTFTIAVVVGVIVLAAVALVFQIAAAVDEDESDRPVEETIDEAIVDALDQTPGVRHVDTVASSLRIDQPVGWGIFAPDPRTTDRYYVFPAETASGERLDVYNERELTYDRPYDELQKQYGTYRERFYMNSIRRGGFSNDAAATLADHICKTWPEDHGEELTHINMYKIGEDVTYETIDSPADRETDSMEIYRHGCGDNEPKVIEPPEY